MLWISAVSFFMRVKLWKRTKSFCRTEYMELSKITMRFLSKLELVLSTEGRTDLVADLRRSRGTIHL